MSKRLMVATAAIALLGGLAGCGTQDDPATPTTTSTTPSASATTDAASTDLTGTWRSEEADWTVRFAADGTFTSDFEGNEDFLSGSYRVEGDTVFLEGDDGVTDEGTLSGDSITFKLGTLERQ